MDVRGILRDGAIVASFQPRFTLAGSIQTTLHYPSSAIWTIDQLGAGTYTCTVQAPRDPGGGCINLCLDGTCLMAMRFNES